MSLGEWLKFFEGIACLHKEFVVLPLWEKYPNHEEDIWDSLAIFLEGYAFERQGRSPNYSHTAVDALFECKEELKGNFGKELTNEVWKRFKEKLENKGLNYRVNPLYPSTNPDNQNNIRRKLSLIELAIKYEIHKSSLTTYLKNLKVREAFNCLIEVRGVKEKIASFFLRDLVDVLQIDTQRMNMADRKLLQPVDIWVERTVETLSENLSGNPNLPEWIVENSLKHKVNPERVNMGIWFFGANIAVSEYRLKKALNKLDEAKNFKKEFLKKAARILKCQESA